MTLAVVGYFTVTIATLLALARIILQVGLLMGDCPQTGSAVRAGAVAVASGFVAIGLGGVILTASAIPALANQAQPSELAVVVLLTIGFACLTLGLGFAHALRNLRAIVQPPKATPLEPVLA
jgi:hypothetical protein